MAHPSGPHGSSATRPTTSPGGRLATLAHWALQHAGWHLGGWAPDTPYFAGLGDVLVHGVDGGSWLASTSMSSVGLGSRTSSSVGRSRFRSVSWSPTFSPRRKYAASRASFSSPCSRARPLRGQVQQSVGGDRAGVRSRPAWWNSSADRGGHAVGARHQLASTRHVGAELLRQGLDGRLDRDLGGTGVELERAVDDLDLVGVLERVAAPLPGAACRCQHHGQTTSDQTSMRTLDDNAYTAVVPETAGPWRSPQTPTQGQPRDLLRVRQGVGGARSPMWPTPGCRER